MNATAIQMATWRLAGKIGEDSAVRHVPIDECPFKIGRSSNQHLSIPVPTVSSAHAEILVVGNDIELRDLGSTNGTFVNGVRLVDSCKLNEGDLVQFAQEVFRVERAEEGNRSRTMLEDSADHALSLIQFDKLISDRAVVPHFQPIVKLEPIDSRLRKCSGRSPDYMV